MSRNVVWSLMLLSFINNSLATTNIYRVGSSLPNVSRTIDYSLKNVYDGIFPPYLWLLQQAVENIENVGCKESVKLILAAQTNLSSWASKFYDASGKFPKGVLAGSIYQLGEFDECLEIGENDAAPQGMAGQYCLMEINVEVPEEYLMMNGSVWENFRKPTERYLMLLSNLYWGICVPATCRAKDLQNIVGKIIHQTFNESKLHLGVSLPENSCYKNALVPLENADIIYASLILVAISAVVIGTVFHFVYLKSKGKVPEGTLSKVLIAFSLISNMKKLFSPAHDNELYLDCLAGIKLISMVFIIVGHTLMFVMSGPVSNKKFLEEAFTKVENTIFLNSALLVDTFLLLSGFLFCRILLFELNKRKSVNIPALYIFRYLRLTPAYLVVLGLYVTWLPRLDVGPLWYKITTEKERCLQSWWANILYINNYINSDNLCMFQSWYLAVDTQLFLLAPAVIYPLWKWRRFGECLLAFCTLVSVVIPFVITFVNNLDPSLMFYASEMNDIQTNKYYAEYYIKTHMKSTAYCFGLICGYVIYRMQTSDYRLSQKTQRLGWIFCAVSLLASMASISIFYSWKQNIFVRAFYAAFHRVLWSAGVCWVLIACIVGKTGMIRDILRWRLFVPLSRLTYSAYLVNGLVELHSIATLRSPQYLSTYNMLMVAISHVIITFFGAVVLSMTFESPILALERIFLQQHKENSTKVKQSVKEPNNLPGERM